MNKITPEPKNKLEEKPIATGQIYINSDGCYLRVGEIDDSGIHFQMVFGNRWTSYGIYKPERIKKELVFVADNEDGITKFEKSAMAKFIAGDFEFTGDKESTETSLILTSNKESLESAISVIETQKAMIEGMKRFIKAKIDSVNSVIGRMNKKIAQLHRVVLLFELYLGVYEELIQISDGEPAPAETPISIRQLVLFMDEEFGDPRMKNGQPGIDWQSVEDFDRWAIDHIDQVAPETRCIVALNPSRQRREYSDNPWISSMLNSKNKVAYFLIRNGEKIYRVYAADLNVGDKLFPTSDETDALFNAIKESDEVFSREDHAQYIYARNAMILQGLLDRTPVMEPLPGRVNLFNPEESTNVVYVRDAEFTLGDGRIDFWDWLKGINEKLQAGSRIFFSNSAANRFEGYKVSGRRFLFYTHDNYPTWPDSGVYQVSLTDNKRKLRIKFNPGDTVYTTGWEWNPHERKNAISLLIDKSDRFLINVDQIDPEDIRYYLNDRVQRKNYIAMMPLLWGVLDFVQVEREKEKHFVTLVAGRLEVDESKVWEAVDWWKFKNQWKRSISDDDPKALRMIEKRIRGK